MLLESYGNIFYDEIIIILCNRQISDYIFKGSQQFRIILSVDLKK